ncbi:MAG: tetratricopeptide repeat protein, partial [Syntrophorhabdus sp.]
LKGERITAISYCLKGIENHPLDRGVANALVTLGDIFQPIDLAFSFQMYRQTITMNPGHDLGYMKLCNLYYSLGQFDSALSLCSDAVRLNPDNSFNYENLGNVYLKMEQYDKAMTSYVKALSINPNLPASHHNLALIYYFSKQYDLAIKHYKAAVSLGMTVNQEFQKTVEQHIRGNPKKDGSHGNDG